MLIKLLPEQISKYWNLIGHAIEVAAPPTVHCSPGRMNNILQSLLEDRMQCWMMVEKLKGDDERTLGIIATTVTEEACSGLRNLLIYAVFSYSNEIIPLHIWQDSLEVLKKYAKSLGCHRIVAFSDVPRIIQIAKKILGANTDHRVILIDI